jgi:hypothetical protein
MALPSSPIAYYPLGTSSFNGEYLAENNAIGDYVFDFIPTNDVNAGHIDFFDSSTTDFFDSSTTLSISGWFNFDDISVNRDLMSQWVGNTTNGSFSLRRSSGNLLIVFIRTGSSSSGSDYYYANLATSSTGHSVGVWYHLAVTLDNGTCLIYLNGQALTTSIGGSPQATLQASTADFKLSFDGKMSNIKLWSSKLEATEVETLYNYGSPIRTLANIPQSSSLKAWYKLDASDVYNSTTTEWSIDNNQNPSAYPSSLDFDAASSDYIQINNGSSLTNGFSELTVSIWANFSSNLSEQQIISKDGATSQRSWNLRKLSSGVNFLVSTNGTSGSQTLFYPNANITLGRWYHFVGIYDGSKLLLYVDGVLIDDSVSLTGSLPSTTSGLFIGSYDYNNSTTFDGKLSNAQVFNTALPATGSNSVETLYNNGSPLTSMTGFTSLVSWWKLNNTTTGIEDAKGSNNGTNNGATEYAGFVNKLVGDSSQANLVQSDLQTVAPYSKYAMEFDASSGDYIDCGQNTNLDTGDLSVSIWINKDSTGSGIQYIFNNNNGSSIAGFSILMNGINSVYIDRRTRTYSANTGYTDVGFTTDTWHHLCFTYNDNLL